MTKIMCMNCNKIYDVDKHKECPKCGYDNEDWEFYERGINNDEYEDFPEDMPVACRYCNRDAYPNCIDNCIE